MSWTGCWMPGRWPPGGRTSGGHWSGSATWWPRKFGVRYTIPGIWYLPRRRGRTCQLGSRGAVELGDGAIEVWKKETWSRGRKHRVALGAWIVVEDETGSR